MNCLSLLSIRSDSDATIADLLGRLEAGLDGGPADLVVLFGSAGQKETLAPLASRIRASGLGTTVIGCSGESIVGEDREIEDGPAVAAWAIQLPGATIEAEHLSVSESGATDWTPSPDLNPSDALILLGDPFTFPTDRFLAMLQKQWPGLKVVGGMASAGRQPGGNRLIVNDEVFGQGAVLTRLSGPIGLRTVVSQGCRPIGRTMIVTKVDRNVVKELGRRPAYEVLREIFDALDDDEKALLQNGLHIGRVINEYQETFQRGDFLVRNVLGADDTGGLAINDTVRVGQTVQFHVRDAGTADEDLRNLLDGVAAPARGALLFTCNGRGTRLFPAPDHDVKSIHECLGPIPVAGFFAMGELGPVGDQNFVHGFTASVAIFEEPRPLDRLE